MSGILNEERSIFEIVVLVANALGRLWLLNCRDIEVERHGMGSIHCSVPEGMKNRISSRRGQVENEGK